MYLRHNQLILFLKFKQDVNVHSKSYQEWQEMAKCSIPDQEKSLTQKEKETEQLLKEIEKRTPKDIKKKFQTLIHMYDQRIAEAQASQRPWNYESSESSEDTSDNSSEDEN